ncbi:MAG TPA: phytase [Candidatus Binatia bacterium]
MKNRLQNDNEASKETTSAEISRRVLGRRAFLKSALATAPLLIAGPTVLLTKKTQAAPKSTLGPSTTTEPYLVPNVPGVKFISILTVGDSIDGYRMVGIPDGLGAYASINGNFTLLMNHELGGTSGIARAHGSPGSFVSRWIIDRETLKVHRGRDFTQTPNDVYTFDPATGQYLQGTLAWQRFCSGDLAKEGAFYFKGLGTTERIYLNGEETTSLQNSIVVDQGRAWARVATGGHADETWHLPRFGRMAYENVVASPYPQEKTIVVLLDDSSINTAPVINNNVPSEVYFYIGRKRKNGHPIVAAGLTNGNFYGMKVSVKGNPVTEESNDFGLGTAATGFVDKGRFSLHDMGDVSGLSAVQIEESSIAEKVTRLQRVEDGAWDPKRKKDFYFVTTASLTANCRLWRLRFDDIERPERGGTIEILLKGDEGHGMLDNVTIDHRGRIFMDEDPGGNDRVAKIWLYDISTGDFIQVGAHNPKFFEPSIVNNSDFVTSDEESSGIIDAEHILGKGWFLLDVQVHKPNPDPELVEGGQLLAMYVDPGIGGRNNKDDDDQDGEDSKN